MEEYPLRYGVEYVFEELLLRIFRNSCGCHWSLDSVWNQGAMESVTEILIFAESKENVLQEAGNFLEVEEGNKERKSL